MGNYTDRQIIRQQRDLLSQLVAGGGVSTGGGGGTAGPATYVHPQTEPATEWIIDHDLGYRPGGINVISTGGLAVEPDVVYVGLSRVILSFGSTPLTGTAYLS